MSGSTHWIASHLKARGTESGFVATLSVLCTGTFAPSPQLIGRRAGGRVECLIFNIHIYKYLYDKRLDLFGPNAFDMLSCVDLSFDSEFDEYVGLLHKPFTQFNYICYQYI
jgi:hypothetical protein